MIDAQVLRARLAGRLLPCPAVPARTGTVGAPVPGDRPAGNASEEKLVPAAVLVPFLLGPAPGVLLTKRTAHLNAHAGQVSFPGGRIDPDDPSPEAAALREADEEIGLAPAQVELLGRLGDHVTGTGYRITPVVGLLPAAAGLEGLGLTLSPAEVEAIFVLPLAVLLDPVAPWRRQVEWRGRSREFWVWPHPEYDIWGATAGILVQLATALRGE